MPAPILTAADLSITGNLAAILAPTDDIRLSFSLYFNEIIGGHGYYHGGDE
jgi:hypothetical protein